jgi:hypothetical protein
MMMRVGCEVVMLVFEELVATASNLCSSSGSMRSDTGVLGFVTGGYSCILLSRVTFCIAVPEVGASRPLQRFPKQIINSKSKQHHQNCSLLFYIRKLLGRE